MRGLMIAAGVLALALGGCLQQTGERTEAGCTAQASKTWRPDSATNLKVEAYTEGPDCEHAVATLVVRDADETVLWEYAVATEHVMMLAPARSRHAMQTALSTW